jgi:hypothetical protein
LKRLKKSFSSLQEKNNIWRIDRKIPIRIIRKITKRRKRKQTIMILQIDNGSKVRIRIINLKYRFSKDLNLKLKKSGSWILVTMNNCPEKV